MKKMKYIALLLPLLAMLGCQEEYKAPVSNVLEMSGKWWVELYYDDNKDGAISEDELIYTYHDIGEPGIVTSNTASNTGDSIFVLDPAGIWPFKAKIPVDIANLTMKPATGLPNLEIEEESLSVIDGKVLKGAATTLSGGKTDSIFMEIEFSDDAESWYIFTGHRDTGLPEDQH